MNGDIYNDEDVGGGFNDPKKTNRGHRQGHHRTLEDKRLKTKEDESKNVSIFRYIIFC
jgi:hypothetical protein